MAENEVHARANRELVDALRRSKLFRDYERVFEQATGLPLALRPLEYWQLAHHGKRNENPFARSSPQTRRRSPSASEPMKR